MTTFSTRYRYRAARADGALVTGTIDAATPSQAGGALVERGLHPLEVRPMTGGESRRATASRRDLSVLFRSLASLVDAGVPLDRALGASEPLVRGALREAVADARRALREGRTLAQALEARAGVVPALALGMVRAGERGGRLGQALGAVAQHLEQEADLVARVRQALAYPLMVGAVGTVSTVLIGTVVVPRFAELLGDLGQALPPATRVLLAGSAFLSRYGIALCAGLLASGAALGAWARQPAGRRRVDEGLLMLPLIGGIRHALATARIARALAGLLETGMPLLAALDAAREAAGDTAVAARVSETCTAVAQGRPLAQSLERTRALTPGALQLVAVGESSGRLAMMTERAGQLAAQEAERTLKTLTNLLEPSLIIVFGALVGFVAAALFQAVYSLRPGA